MRASPKRVARSFRYWMRTITFFRGSWRAPEIRVPIGLRLGVRRSGEISVVRGARDLRIVPAKVSGAASADSGRDPHAGGRLSWLPDRFRCADSGRPRLPIRLSIPRKKFVSRRRERDVRGNPGKKAAAVQD